jgi:hypothetical protein
MTDLILRAPKGKFRIVGVDTFDGGDWIKADVSTLQAAKTICNSETEGKQMLKYHVYNDEGKHVYEAGSF